MTGVWVAKSRISVGSPSSVRRAGEGSAHNRCAIPGRDAVRGSAWSAGEEPSAQPVCDSDPALLSFAVHQSGALLYHTCRLIPVLMIVWWL